MMHALDNGAPSGAAGAVAAAAGAAAAAATVAVAAAAGAASRRVSRPFARSLLLRKDQFLARALKEKEWRRRIERERAFFQNLLPLLYFLWESFRPGASKSPTQYCIVQYCTSTMYCYKDRHISVRHRFFLPSKRRGNKSVAACLKVFFLLPSSTCTVQYIRYVVWAPTPPPPPPQ